MKHNQWFAFLQNDTKKVAHPFVDLETTVNAETLDCYTDAAKGKTLGFGGVHGWHWFFRQWEVRYTEQYNLSIEYLELFVVCVSIYIWMNRIRNRRIVLFCDNQVVVNMINNTSAKCRNCMKLIRLLMSHCLLFNCRVFACWVRGSTNLRANYLSRQKIDLFRQITMNMHIDCDPEWLPSELWPLSKL